MLPQVPATASAADIVIAFARQYHWRRGEFHGPIKQMYQIAQNVRWLRFEMGDGPTPTDLDFAVIPGLSYLDAAKGRVKRGGWIIGGYGEKAPKGAHSLPNRFWALRVTDETVAVAENGGKVAFVAGGAASVGDDLQAALELLGRPADFVVACNDVGAEIEKLDAWVSIHGGRFPRWKRKRTANGFDPVPTYTNDPTEASAKEIITDWRLPGQVTGGASGLYAAKVALVDLGADKVILCGVPMDDSPHFNDDAPWQDADAHWPAFEELDANIKARIRSMSGRTADYLGKPDQEWVG